MSGNYSDSEEEDYEFTTTNVTLGYAVKEETEDKISHLGGEPQWPIPTSPLDTRLAKCKSCNRLMTLLLQLDGEVPDSPHGRVFYVFACVQKGCRRKPGGVRAIRGVVLRKGALKKEEEEKEEKRRREEGEKVRREREREEKGRIGSMLFGGSTVGGGASAGGNPFSMGAGGSVAVNPFSMGAANPFSTTSQQTSSPAIPTGTSSSSSSPPRPNPPPTRSFADTLKHNLPPPAPVSSADSDSEPLFYGPPEPWPAPLPHKFPQYYLDAEYEQLDATTPHDLLLAAGKGVKDIPSASDLLDISDDQPSSSRGGGGGGGDGEDWGGYSKSSLDKTFQRFADIVAQNPEQVLRYEHKGLPLLYSKSDEVGRLFPPPTITTTNTSSASSNQTITMKHIPPCPLCKKPRNFEFQLMPHAIAMLESEEGLASFEDGMEWGTIIVCTCTCVPPRGRMDGNGVGYVEEWVGVQWEELKK